MKINRTLALFLFGCITITSVKAQIGINADYAEITDNYTYDLSGWEKIEDGLHASWASKDEHYKKKEVPAIKLKTDTVVYGWRGERVFAEALIFGKNTTDALKLSLSDWKKGNKIIPASQGQARFVNYVLSDDKKGCGTNPKTSTTLHRPDVIDIETTKVLYGRSTRPVWITLEIPRDAESGEYTATLDISSSKTGEILKTLTLRINVVDQTLPLPSEQTFHLDFWQQPYSVPRYYKVQKWSQAHFDAMRPYMELLARAGQRCVTAILFYEPWGVQSNDKHDEMVKTTKNADGTWSYDYTIFDRWVEFMDSCGINQQINCYSMIPWDKTFKYYDAAQGKDVNLKCEVSSTEYSDLWIPFLKAFAAHLKEKGWYEKTCIAMDERELSDMLKAYEILQTAVPGMKMSLAGNHHSQLADKLFDYSVNSAARFTESELKARREKGYHSTVYYCCSEYAPNIFTNSPPAEGAYLPFFSLANDFEGLLHWSYMDWVDDPLRDSRFKLFPAGDTYCIYPGGRSSIRFERLIEGIQGTEKVRILRKQYKTAGETEKLQKLEDALQLFASGTVDSNYPASYAVNYIESILNGAPEPVQEITDYCDVKVEEIKNSYTNRYLTKVSTSDATINQTFAVNTPPSNGIAEMPGIVKVKKGSTFKVETIALQNSDDLRYCRAALYADWNNDSVFSLVDDELIERVGKANTANTELLDKSFSVTVPENAAIGKTKMRLVYADAWRPEPTPCGTLTKGYCFDMPLDIYEGDLTSVASHAVAQDYSWSGGILTLGQPATLTVYNASGAYIDRKDAAKTYDTSNFMPGNYIIAIHDGKAKHQSIKFVK